MKGVNRGGGHKGDRMSAEAPQHKHRLRLWLFEYFTLPLISMGLPFGGGGQLPAPPPASSIVQLTTTGAQKAAEVQQQSHLVAARQAGDADPGAGARLGLSIGEAADGNLAGNSVFQGYTFTWAKPLLPPDATPTGLSLTWAQPPSPDATAPGAPAPDLPASVAADLPASPAPGLPKSLSPDQPASSSAHLPLSLRMPAVPPRHLALVQQEHAAASADPASAERREHLVQAIEKVSDMHEKLLDHEEAARAVVDLWAQLRRERGATDEEVGEHLRKIREWTDLK
jgi:hypothetical protein